MSEEPLTVRGYRFTQRPHQPVPMIHLYPTCASLRSSRNRDLRAGVFQVTDQHKEVCGRCYQRRKHEQLTKARRNR